MEKIPLTKNGLKKLEAERNKLRDIDKPAIIKAISDARELGDLSENAEYHAAREQQGLIEARITFLTNVISNAEVIDPKEIKSEEIIFGATVKLLSLDDNKEKVYQIVGEEEASLEEGLISFKSPLGQALIRKRNGDIIDLEDQHKSWEILEVTYK